MSGTAEAQTLHAVILAAGASTRMGTPKARLLRHGETFLVHCVRAARHAGAREVCVVGGAESLSAEAARAGCDYAHNADWQRGPLSSLQTGLRVLPAGPVLVLSVDRPHLASETLRRLAHAVVSDRHAIWQPAARDDPERHGHPIVWPEDLRAALLALDPQATPRTLLSRVSERRAFVPVDDPAPFENLDRPEDLAALAAREANP